MLQLDKDNCPTALTGGGSEGSTSHGNDSLDDGSEDTATDAGSGGTSAGEGEAGDDDQGDESGSEGGEGDGGVETETYCRDADGDGYGDPEDCVDAEDPPGGYVPGDNGSDCDDADAGAHPGAAEHEDPEACTKDTDGDGYGDADPPPGVDPGQDCDDDSMATFPGAAELDDENACMTDADDDGRGDADPASGVTPGSDCLDQDAAGTGCTVYCLDADLDGYGDPQSCQESPVPVPGAVPNALDCNDGEAGVHPGAASKEPTLCTIDADGDGYGDASPPAGAEAGTDCVDEDANVWLGAADLEPNLCARDVDDDGYGDSDPPPGADAGADCLDTDLNAYPGAAQNEPSLCAIDVDDDGYGDAAPPAGVDPGTDCLDSHATVFVGAAASEPLLCAQDADEDGYGDADPPAGADAGTDCLDDNADVYTGAAQHEASLCTIDDDDDGYGSANTPVGADPGTDCDDLDVDVQVGCEPCPAGELFCNAAENVAQCNVNGTHSVVTDVCAAGCNEASPSCWAELTVSADDVCISLALNESHQFSPTVTGGDGNYTYAWSPTSTLDNQAASNPVATPTDTTTYTLTITDGEGNVAADEVTVHVEDKAWLLSGGCTYYELYDGPNPSYTFSSGGTVACNSVNGGANAFVCPRVFEEARITGNLIVTDDANDDDHIGFVWGWQDASHFYIFSWKAAAQTMDGYALSRGVTIKRIHGDGTPLTRGDLFQAADTTRSTVLMAPAQFYTGAWVEGANYKIEIDYGAGSTTIVVRNATTDAVIASGTVVDDNYPSGQFGTMDHSQSNSCTGPWYSTCL